MFSISHYTRKIGERREALAPLRSHCFGPVVAPKSYSIQSDNTTSSRLGRSGSLVFRSTRKSWGPAIPACIVNCNVISVCWPGFNVVAPTTARGGQQPSTSRTWGWPRICSVSLPSLRTTKRAVTGCSTCTRPKSIVSGSTTSRPLVPTPGLAPGRPAISSVPPRSGSAHRLRQAAGATAGTMGKRLSSSFLLHLRY